MSKVGNKLLLAASIIVLVLTTTVWVSAQTTSGPPDATLFTTYNINATHTSVNWLVCGSTQQSSGCYASGSLGPFGKVGALLEGNQSSNLTTNTVTRVIYVLDIATGSNLNGVTFYVYKKIDTITSTYDTVSVTLSKTVSLPLIGGSSALSSMAANNKYLQSPNGLEVQKVTFAITQIGGFSPPINVAAITADKYGYVTLTLGSFNGGENGFVVIGRDGFGREDGGGAQFMLNTVQAVLPSTLP